ncbi:hypothetical protein OAC41_04640, partial [Acidimicrobiales bacterium]|nr:hypothetical protein [Acidimicrobiales bacterium]
MTRLDGLTGNFPKPWFAGVIVADARPGIWPFTIVAIIPVRLGAALECQRPPLPGEPLDPSIWCISQLDQLVEHAR